MKKIFNKIGQVLQLVLVAPVKLPGKVGNVLKYLALGLGIIETVLDEAREQPELQEDLNPKDNAKLKEISPDAVYKDSEELMQGERSEANESE